MDDLDLNIENYHLDDIIHLFHVRLPFDEEDLKIAKKKVLKTHPDKSGLKPEVFLFYSKAYKKLFSIWEFSNKHRLLQQDNKYNIDDVDEKNHKEQLNFSKDKKKALKQFFSDKKIEDPKKFNKWFNEEFEKTNIISDEVSNGYGNWLQSNDDLEEEKELNNNYTIGEEMERKKKQIRDLTINKDIQEINAFGSFGTQLASLHHNPYTSDIFSNLHYEDLKKAYTETVVPVTIEDYNNKQKFNSLDEIKLYRSTQDVKPLSELQANNYLSNRAKLENTETIYSAYKLANQSDKLNKKQEDFWSNILKITNK
jgi:hypothetical protein